MTAMKLTKRLIRIFGLDSQPLALDLHSYRSDLQAGASGHIEQ
jgi:hypothetical protein